MYGYKILIKLIFYQARNQVLWFTIIAIHKNLSMSVPPFDWNILSLVITITVIIRKAASMNTFKK